MINEGDIMIQNSTAKEHKPLTERENWLGGQLVDIAIKIHHAFILAY